MLTVAEARGDRDGRHVTPPSSLSERLSVLMTKLGAVPVTPRNMLKLFKAGECVLLYPGGAKEALHQKVRTDCAQTILLRIDYHAAKQAVM